MNYIRQLSTVLFIIAIPVALVTTNIRVVLNEPRLYTYAADHYDTPATTGIDRDEILRASGELRDYFNNDADTIFIRVQKDGAPISLFSERETLHLQDVKSLLKTSFRVQELAMVFVLAYVVAVFIWAREGSLRLLAKQVLLSTAVSVSLIAALGVVAISGFEGVFEQFHVIAFDNDLWKLNPQRDHLIQMFPQGFWETVSLWIGLASLAELGLLAGGAVLYIRFSGGWEDGEGSLSADTRAEDGGTDEEQGRSSVPAQPDENGADLNDEADPSASLEQGQATVPKAHQALRSEEPSP